jgi:hypothetical protein
MIVCLRFKRVQRLLHHYVVPGLCASALALGGCALPSTTAPGGPASDSAMKGPIAAVSMEPSIQVGDVTAIYITVTNLRSDLDPLSGYQNDQVIVLQMRAVAQSRAQVDRLDVDHAIEKAGAADKLLAALGDRGFEDVEFPPPPEPSAAKKAAVAIGVLLLAPILAPLLLQKLSELPVDYAFGDFSDKQQIKSKEFRVVQPHGGAADFIKPQRSWKGYLFFPRGSYSTLEITAGALDSVVLEKRTGLASLIAVSPASIVAQQLDRGESPNLRHTETLRCPWRQK